LPVVGSGQVRRGPPRGSLHESCSTRMSPSSRRPSQGSTASRSAPRGVAATLVRHPLRVVSTTTRCSVVRPAGRSEDRPAAPTGFVTLSGFGLRCPHRSLRTGSPLSGFRTPSATSAEGSVSPGPSTGPAPSVLGVSHPLDGLLSLRPCGHAGSAAAHGVLASQVLSDGWAENALPRLLRPFVHGALQSRTLRNTRSRAPQTRRHLCPSALVPRPWFQIP